MGIAVDLAAEAAGVSRSTFMGWMARGRDESLAREAGEKPDDQEGRYLELYERVRSARAAAAVRAMANIRRVADGGVVTKVVTRRMRDSATGQIVEETTEDRTAPDWRADAWYLERQHPEHYGKDASVSLEVTGAGGGPVQIENSAHVEALAARLSESLHAITYPDQLEPGDDVQDAEIIDEAS